MSPRSQSRPARCGPSAHPPTATHSRASAPARSGPGPVADRGPRRGPPSRRYTARGPPPGRHPFDQSLPGDRSDRGCRRPPRRRTRPGGADGARTRGRRARKRGAGRREQDAGPAEHLELPAANRAYFKPDGVWKLQEMGIETAIQRSCGPNSRGSECDPRIGRDARSHGPGTAEFNGPPGGGPAL